MLARAMEKKIYTEWKDPLIKSSLCYFFGIFYKEPFVFVVLFSFFFCLLPFPCGKGTITTIRGYSKIGHWTLDSYTVSTSVSDYKMNLQEPHVRCDSYGLLIDNIY